MLSLRDVSVRLGESAILDGVDLTALPGEVLLLAGRNGAGKTTLLRVAAGLLAPDRGEVFLGEQPMASFRRRDLAREIALVPQDTTVPFPYSVLELVLMGRAPHLGWLGFETAADRVLAQEALARLGIEGLAERSVLTLSGGERQLVAIARALVQASPLLLLDEPAAHLDLARRVELRRLLRELAAEGRTVVLVSHDLAAAAAMADRVALLAQGRIEAVGAPAEVLVPEHVKATFGVAARWIETEVGPVLRPE